MNELMLNYEGMSDEELEIYGSQLVEVRIARLTNKLKQVQDSLNKVGVEIGIINNDNKELKGRLEEQKNKVGELEDVIKTTSIDRFQHDELQNIMKKRVFHFVGKIGSDKYILFFSGYKSGLLGGVKKNFGENDIPLSSIKDLKITDFEKAKIYINQWTPKYLNSKILSDWIVKDNNGEASTSQANALHRFLDRMNSNKEEE